MIPIELPPGVYFAPTGESRSVNWREVNLTRWESNKLSPIGGWEERAYPPFESRLRAIHEWVSNNGAVYVAYLCEGHLYVDIAGTVYDISPTVPIEAPSSDVEAGGYGTYRYGRLTYGTPRPARTREKAITPAFTLDNWGEDLLAMVSTDGRLLRWTPPDGEVVSAAVTDAPSGRTFAVTPERHVIIFGLGGDSRRFGWCDQENIENWEFADIASKAGFYDVEPAAPITAAKKTNVGTLFFTTKKAYIIESIGLPYVYNYREIGESSVPLSSASIVTAGESTVWYAENGFWEFRGVAVQPLASPLLNWILDNIAPVYSRYESTMFDVVSKSEIWFCFPSTDARYNDKYVIHNYRDQWWAMGTLSRSCGYGSSFNSYPIMSDGIKVYNHEKGLAYPDASDVPWAETFSMNSEDGAMITIRQMLPDVKGAYANVAFNFIVSKARVGPDSNIGQQTSTDKLIRADGLVDVRVTGSDIRMRIKARTKKADPWTMGQTLIDIVRRGNRRGL